MKVKFDNKRIMLYKYIDTLKITNTNTMRLLVYFVVKYTLQI